MKNHNYAEIHINNEPLNQIGKGKAKMKEKEMQTERGNKNEGPQFHLVFKKSNHHQR